MHAVAPSLTVENIMAVLKGIERKWDFIGSLLCVPEEKRSAMKKQLYFTDKDQLRKILMYMLSLHPFASWRVIMNALHWMREHQLAESIWEFAEPLTGSYV